MGDNNTTVSVFYTVIIQSTVSKASLASLAVSASKEAKYIFIWCVKVNTSTAMEIKFLLLLYVSLDINIWSREVYKLIFNNGYRSVGITLFKDRFGISQM